MKSRVVIIGILVSIACVFGCRQAEKSPQLTKARWIQDLDYAKMTLIDKHPDIYYRISKVDFDLTVKKAVQKIMQSHTDEECVAAIRHVVASICDGHTSLVTNSLPGYRDIFPVRMYEFSDGIFITGIAQQFTEYLGAQVLRIGKFPAEESLRRAGTLAYADNEFSRKNQSPLIVVTCKFAHGLGITKNSDKLALMVETKNGKREEIVLSSVTPRRGNDMLRGMDIGPEGMPFVSALTGTGKELPLYLKHLDGDHNYWFEHDKGNKAIYMQFNLVIHQENESFEQFYKRMFDYMDENKRSIDKFILDLRFNNGGNGLMVLPFMNEIIERNYINRLGHLYVLTGRRSFSAAVLLVAEMMIHTNALLVGEPSGASQNMFSDMVNRGTLPNSGAVLFVSSEYFNIAWPAGKNHAIPPHFPAPFSSADFFSGKDPALEAIYANKVKAVEMVLHQEGPEAAQKFLAEIYYDWEDLNEEWNIMPFTFPISTKYSSEHNVLAGMLKRIQDKK